MSTVAYMMVNLVALFLIIFVVWWFWLGKKDRVVKASRKIIDISVANGVYTPDAVTTKVGKTLKLRFTREDETPCSAAVVFNDFNVSADLPVGKPVVVTLIPDKKGEFEFTCQMAMYRGKIIVE